MSITNKFKKTKDGTVIFTGNSLEVTIPERYKRYGCLVVEEQALALGIFDMIVDGEESGLLAPALIRMEPSSIETINVGNSTSYLLTFVKGDIFLHDEVVKDPMLAYVIFDNFISLGKLPNFITYWNIPYMFDMATRITGSKFRVDHAVFEMIYAYLYRDAQDPAVQYRHTTLKNKPQFVPLRQAAQLAESITSKLLGPYFDDAVDSAIINESDSVNDTEELLRK